jgi:hypothetical protein
MWTSSAPDSSFTGIVLRPKSGSRGVLILTHPLAI